MTDDQITAAVHAVYARHPIGQRTPRGTVYAVGWSQGRVRVWIDGVGAVDASEVIG